jgi:golgi to ER traffic protein 4
LTVNVAKIINLASLMGPTGTWRKSFLDAVFTLVDLFLILSNPLSPVDKISFSPFWEKFLESSWTSSTSLSPCGDVQLHAFYGDALFKEKDYQAALPHLILSPDRDSSRTLAELLFDWSKLDPEGVIKSSGRYAARGVLS